ncbi:nuclear transport factor 2 family protein [Streptomyces sp. NPDC102360]|uniref:nuclear transport factor 2 family protein n=1 Tax=Streptomyces sp. NPDC102360 TaxID=3366160 RepID=UPI003809965A
MTSHTAHFEISDLVSRFFHFLDERQFPDGWAAGFFTEDASADTPVGRITTREEVARHTRTAVERFARTLHLASDLVVTLDGDRATAVWHAHMTHVHRPETQWADPLFTVGGIFDADLLRTPDGWRFKRQDVEAVWTTGQPPGLTA